MLAGALAILGRSLPKPMLREGLPRAVMHLINEYLAVGNAEDAAKLITVVLNVATENKIDQPDGRAYTWIPFKEFTETGVRAALWLRPGGAASVAA